MYNFRPNVLRMRIPRTNALSPASYQARLAGVTLAPLAMHALPWIMALSCLGATVALAGDNTTVYPYQIDASSLSQQPITTAVIASEALGKPARQYLREHEENVDKAVTRYLSKNGITVADNSEYQDAFDAAQRRFGAPYNSGTDHLDTQVQQQVLGDVFGQLQQSQPEVNAIIFTELVNREVYFSSGLKRMARWDGVSRSPLMQGPAQGVPANFNWAQPVDAVSIAFYIFTVSGKRVFMSVGGISLTEAIDTRRSKAQFTRYRNVLSNKSQIKEGIKIALHPLIPMKRYPGED